MPSNLVSTDPALAYLQGSPASRYDAGRFQREAITLEAHAELAVDADRTDPLAILAQQDKSRLPELVPLRYGRMSRTPFTFLRGGGCHHGQRSRCRSPNQPVSRALR